jgi:hypothetical protein
MLPDKFIVLVRSEGCDFGKLAVPLAKTGRAMARDARTSRVVIDWPAEPSRNLDLVGRPSPIIAGLEVSADPARLKAVSRKVMRKLGSVCLGDGYLVDERRLSTTPRSWQLGEASPQTKVLVAMLRRADIAREDFVREWTQVHPGLSLGWRRSRGTAGHYVQNVVVDVLDGSSRHLDGIGEIEGKAEAPVSDAERKARAESAEHAQSFQEIERSAMFTAREVILKD